jgi:hypothetical protein
VVWALKDSGGVCFSGKPESATGRALMGPRPGRGRPETVIELEPGESGRAVAGYGGTAVGKPWEPGDREARGDAQNTILACSVRGF